MLANSIDILCFGETKLDDSYPDGQFHVPGYSLPYREDGKSEHSGGLLVYVNENIPSKKLSKIRLCYGIEVIPVEINLRKSKWLILAIYRPDWVEKVKFLDSISSLIDFYNSYENIQILGDFNMTPDDPHLITFMEGHNLYNLINEPTCFKSTNGNCIDLILTNQKHSHMFSQTCEVEFSDCNVMIYTMLKTTFTKLPPK